MAAVSTSLLKDSLKAFRGNLWLLTFIILGLLYRLVLSYRRFKALPPGPRGLPIIGNAHQVSLQIPWFKFTEWAQEFGEDNRLQFDLALKTTPTGPIFCFHIAGQTVVVLNTFQVASDLLDNHSAIYSDRPRLVMAGEILTGGLALPFTTYGNLFRKLRRAAHEGLSVRAVEKLKAIQGREAVFAVLQMLKAPDSWERHIKRATAASVLSSVYGLPSITDKDEPIVKGIHGVAHKMTESLVPGAYLVYIFPLLKLAPPWMAKWKRGGLDWFIRQTQMFESFNKEVEENMTYDIKPNQASSTAILVCTGLNLLPEMMITNLQIRNSNQ